MGNEAVHLLFSMNRWEEKKKILDMLNSGTHIVCDRYAYSGVAYSIAKGLEFEWCNGADRGLIKPDLTIYFQASADQLSKRNGYGEELFETVEFQRKVEEGYKNFTRDGIADKVYMSLSGSNLNNRWINLDLSASPSIDEVHSRIVGIITKYQKQFASDPEREMLTD